MFPQAAHLARYHKSQIAISQMPRVLRPRARAPRPCGGALRPCDGASRPCAGASRPRAAALRPCGEAPRPRRIAPQGRRAAARPRGGAPRGWSGAPRGRGAAILIGGVTRAPWRRWRWRRYGVAKQAAIRVTPCSIRFHWPFSNAAHYCAIAARIASTRGAGGDKLRNCLRGAGHRAAMD